MTNDLLANPSISIITPTLNIAAYLAETRRSVLSQAGDFDLQWIVIDGGSTDQTVALLESTGDARLQWVSRPDQGQAAAINIGLAMARGQIVGWLNGDDLYAPGALQAVADAMRANPWAQWLAGRCDIIDKDGRPARGRITAYKNRRLQRFSFKALLRLNMLSQPAVFWRREFSQQVGRLDESLYNTMDYDLWLRMARQCRPLLLDRVLASFRVHEMSKSLSRRGHRGQFGEGYRVACRYAGGDWFSRWIHRLNVEKIVWGYRALRWMGR